MGNPFCRLNQIRANQTRRESLLPCPVGNCLLRKDPKNEGSPQRPSLPGIRGYNGVMVKPNYNQQKKQKELARQTRQNEKRQKRQEKSDPPETANGSAAAVSGETPVKS